MRLLYWHSERVTLYLNVNILYVTTLRTIDICAPDRREGCYTPFANGARRLGSGRPIAVLAKELIELDTAGRYTVDLTAVGLGVTAGRHCALLVSAILFGISGDLTDGAVCPHARRVRRKKKKKKKNGAGIEHAPST